MRSSGDRERLVQTGKLLPPCTGLLAAAVPGSGEVGVKAPSAGGPRVTAGPKDVVRVAGKDEGGDLTAICCTSHHCDSG